MREAIEQRGRELLVPSKHGDPFGEGEIRRDHGRAALIAVGEQIEEQLAADAIEGDETEFVDDEHLDAEEPLLETRQLAGIARFHELPDEIGRARKEHAPLLLRRFDAERDGEMRLAGPDRTRQDQILWRRHPLPTREGVDVRRIDAVRGGKVEGVERFDLWEARLVETLADDGLMARGLLGAEDFVQIVFVGPMTVAGLPGEAFKGAGHAGQLQRPRVGDDEIPDDRGGAHAPTSRSQSS